MAALVVALVACGDGAGDENADSSSTGVESMTESGSETIPGDASESGSDTEDTTGGTGPDGCSDELAGGLSIQGLTAFQVVGIPVAQSGVEIMAADRIAEIVADRELLMRVDLAVEDDWSPRELSARVEVQGEGGTTELYFQRLFVAGSSVGGDPESSFHVELAAESVSVGANYSVSIVECEGMGGVDGSGARFPVSESASLGARQTEPIKIHIVPFRVAGFVPETTPEILDGFASAVRAMYPTPEVILSVGEVFDDGSTVDMGEHLVRLGQLRDQEAAPADLYYYGLISGAETREEFCPSCPTGTSEEAGQSHVGFAVGAAFGDDLSESTLVHELGHMHGRRHSPCGGPNLLDEDYPYPQGNIEVEGYDYRSGSFLPPSTNDLMGYCQPRWVSDYTYRALTAWNDKVAGFGG